MRARVCACVFARVRVCVGVFACTRTHTCLYGVCLHGVCVPAGVLLDLMGSTLQNGFLLQTVASMIALVFGMLAMLVAKSLVGESTHHSQGRQAAAAQELPACQRTSQAHIWIQLQDGTATRAAARAATHARVHLGLACCTHCGRMHGPHASCMHPTCILHASYMHRFACHMARAERPFVN